MNRTRWIAAAAAALAVVLGSGAALGATGSGNPASDFLGDVAERLGVSESKLEDAIEEATIARIDEAVAAGEITKAQGDVLKQRVRSGDVPAVVPDFPGPPFGLGALPHKPPIVPGLPPGGDLLEVAAGYLGMDGADVRAALRDGKSLADLADEQGKSVDGLEQALRGAIRDDAEQAVEDGLLTEEQADRLVTKLSGTVDEVVDAAGGPRLEFGLRGPAFGLGAPPQIVPGLLPGGGLLEAAADYLGMDEADVREALRDGESLADLAGEKGKSVDGLEQALRGAIREQADEAVEAGVLTEDQAGRVVEKLGSAVDELVEGGLDRAFEFRFRVAPDERPAAPAERGRSPIIPLRPI
jgi:lambda repressor-like predicted transcriptional regulator